MHQANKHNCKNAYIRSIQINDAQVSYKNKFKDTGKNL